MFCNRFGAGAYGFRGPHLFMMIPMLIVLLLIAYYIYKAINRRNLNFNVETSSSKAIAILNERFAKGEINEEEYKAKKGQILK